MTFEKRKRDKTIYTEKKVEEEFRAEAQQEIRTNLLRRSS
jgi:hypothetical protein